MSSLKGAALGYAARGWAVFPLAPRAKLPPKGSKGLLDASKDTALIERWWDAVPDYNVAIATGEASGLFVLDIDPRHKGDHYIKLLQEQHGRLPDTVTVLTGGGGFQFYFKHVPGLRNTANKVGKEISTDVDERGNKVTGIDTRGDGGYVAAPPSIHPSGKPYRFYDGRETIGLADAPQWLVNMAKPDGAEGPKAVARPDYFRALFANGAGEGSRNDAVARMAGYLLRARIDPLLTHDIISMWNQVRIKPPLPQTEIDTTVNSVAGKELARLEKKRKR